VLIIINSTKLGAVSEGGFDTGKGVGDHVVLSRDVSQVGGELGDEVHEGSICLVSAGKRR
jgi:hypothetical protein